MNTICGANCDECGFKGKCKGCIASCGNPFGKGCIAAEYINVGGCECFEAFKQKLIDEINDLHIEGMPKVTQLFSLAGFYVNLSYPMPSGETVKLIDDNRIYLGCQLEGEFDDGKGRCYGVIADKEFILVALYGENGIDPELVMYKHR